MAGPRFLATGDIVNPFTALQKSVSNAGDIFREYEEDRRATQIHNEKLKEHYRQDDERTFLRGYTPDSGKDGFGVTDAARTAIEKEFAPLYAKAAEEGRDTAELDAQKAQVYKGAVTREQLERDITGQLRPHVSADRIPGLLPLFSQGVTSLAEMEASELAKSTAVNEAQQNAITNLIASVKAANTGLSKDSSGGSTGSKLLFGGGISSADWNKATEEGNEAIGWIDHKKAYNLVRDEMVEVNKRRAAANLPAIPAGDLDTILASTYRRGYFDHTSDVTDEQKARDVVSDYARNADVAMYTSMLGRGANARTQFSAADMQLIRGGEGARVARSREELEALRVRALVDRYTGRTPTTAAPVPRPSADGTVGSGAGTGGGTTTPGGSGTTTQPAGSGIVVEGGTVRQQQQQDTPSDDPASGAATGVVSEDNKLLLTQQMDAIGMTDPNERAMFLAHMDHESGGFNSMEEDLNYSASRLLEVFPKYYTNEADAQRDAGNPEAIANKVYGGREDLGNTEEGDGYLYRGRGMTQLTGRENYKDAGAALGIDLVNNPDLAAQPDVAAKIATWYWQTKGVGEKARNGDLEGATLIINGGLIGLPDRQAKFDFYRAEGAAGNSGPREVSGTDSSKAVPRPGREAAPDPEANSLADRPLAELENLREQTAQNMERARLAGDNAAVRESILEYQELEQAIARRKTVDLVGEDWTDRTLITALGAPIRGLKRLNEWDNNRVAKVQEARIQEYPEVFAEVRRLRALMAQPGLSRYEEKVLRNQLDKASRRLHSLRTVPRLLQQQQQQ